MIGGLRRHRRTVAVSGHLDEMTISMLLHGADVPAADDAVAHVVGCSACRLRLEGADPIVALFAGEQPPARRPHIAMPRRGRLLALTGRRLAGVGLATAVAAAAAVAVTVGVRVSRTAQTQTAPESHLAQLTAAIRTAAEHHDSPALAHALSEAQSALQGVDDHTASLPPRGDLIALRDEVMSLPQDATTQAVTASVDTAIAIADASASPVADTPPPTVEVTPAPTADTTPQPTVDNTPEATVAATVDATPAASPLSGAAETPQPAP